ncbi:MAG TPA: hypothetical protein VFV80_00265, partial [Geminicoccaceae bacterium]|nr:hypothetical protein [Geminicoccaceae bacterium]
KQMASASLRAYRDGPDTAAARRQIVVDYLNSTPLAARPGFGEVNGLGDGLYAWFGSDLAQVNRALRASPHSPEDQAAKARFYKQVLSLLLAQRRPAHYLAVAGRDDLEALTDSHLRLLRAAGVIGAGLAQAALAQRLQFAAEPPTRADVPFVDQKAANAMRTELLRLLGLPSLYALDRLDLTGTTSIDLAAQGRLTTELRQLTDPDAARDLGLYGFRLLDPNRSGEPLVASLTLYERGPGANYLRVQTDNLNQPFDLNSGAKLDLGSTAKLRTLITYLEIVAGLHDRLIRLAPAERKLAAANAAEPLSQWAAEYLLTGDVGLETMLEAAMARRYSASPWERFFTGGGVHQFANFNADDNGRVMSVAEAFRNSVNLVFIRVMRDIVRFYQMQGAPADAILEDRQHPRRIDYLRRFADREGTTFLNQFHREFAGLSPDQVLDRMADEVRPRGARLAVIFRSLRPDADEAAFAAFLATRLAEPPSPRELARLYDGHGPDRLNLNDRAYVAGLHPLKLWLATWWQEHPGAPRSAVLEAATAVRQESYAWLFKTGSKAKQDKRIRILLEEEAFERIHAAWQRLGYPFDHLVPSYATAIGSSADRPEALAELVGILLNDGVWQPTVRVASLHFAKDTPYETVLAAAPPQAVAVLAPAIARLVRKAMVDVVETGTAVRLRGAFGDHDGAPIAIGAKTGTGDHRRKSFGQGGRLIGSQAVSRTATVVFFVGDRLFGNITVYVPGPDAEGFKFTSSLPAQLLKGLAPAIRPLLDEPGMRTADAKAAGGGA